MKVKSTQKDFSKNNKKKVFNDYTYADEGKIMRARWRNFVVFIFKSI